MAGDSEEADKEHVRPWLIPSSFLTSLLRLPGQLWFIILGTLGIASYPRQIVNVSPRNPAKLKMLNGENVGLSEWVKRNVPSLKGWYTPSWWLPNGHIQTAYSVIGDFNSIDKVEYDRTYLRLPDGGTISIDSTPLNHSELPPDAPTVIVAHGLTGGSHESYVRNLLSWVIRPKEKGGLGARGVVVNSRGCAGTPVTTTQLYSAGSTYDLTQSLHYLRNLHPTSPLHGIGFSLGASQLGNYIGVSGSGSFLTTACLVGCPWDLPAMVDRLENDWFHNRVYSKALATNLLVLFRRVCDQNPTMWQESEFEAQGWLEKLRRMEKGVVPADVRPEGSGKSKRVTLMKVDECMVARFGGPKGKGLWPFRNAIDYYTWASPKNHVGGIQVPTLIINAFDDPVVDARAIPIDEFQQSPYIYAAITGSGGHLGWFDGPMFAASRRRKHRWILTPMSQWYTASARDLGPTGTVRTRQGGEDGANTPRAESSWTWVDRPAHEPQGGGRVGWRVLKTGEVETGHVDSGVMQGL